MEFFLSAACDFCDFFECRDALLLFFVRCVDLCCFGLAVAAAVLAASALAPLSKDTKGPCANAIEATVESSAAANRVLILVILISQCSLSKPVLFQISFTTQGFNFR